MDHDIITISITISTTTTIPPTTTTPTTSTNFFSWCLMMIMTGGDGLPGEGCFLAWKEREERRLLSKSIIITSS